MSNLYKSLKKFLDGTKEKPEIETSIIKPEDTVSLKPFEEKLNYLYMGCYNDNPTQPTMTTQLGNVHNQLECINAGQKGEYKYVALQTGNECLASNKLDFKNMDAVPRKNCNLVCDEATAGFCGGIFKNQVYATSLVSASETPNTLSPPSEQNPNPNPNPTNPNPTNPSKESFKHLENFATHDKEMKLINKNISQIDMVCQEPINKYNLFLSLLIVLLLSYILIEYIYKK
jgi:hypothetical protein